MRHQQPIHLRRGFTLIEALIALLVMAFGILALVGMRTLLTRNADVSKQRTEAVRLAEEKIECLRAYTQMTSDATASATRNCMGALLARDTWAGMATVASDPLNPLTSSFSNTSYTRNWTLGGATTDPMRPVSVTVAWTDRAGANQTYSLTSVISQSNPDDEGSLGFPLPQNSNLKRPKNRNLNIPVPAIDLGGGKSAYQVGTFAVVFSNDSGYVVEKCTGTLSATTYANATAGCANYDAYIIAGYVSGDTAWTSSVANTLPTGINTASLTGWDNSGSKTIACSYSPTTQATDQNTGSAVAGVYRYYLCVVPITSGGTYSGTVRLAGMTAGTSGAATSNTNWLVCRFEYPASTLWPNDNERNVQPYASVGSSLDSQNYYIVSSSSGASNPCPTVSVTTGNGPSQQTFGVQTKLHQDCRTGFMAANCPTTYSGS